MVGAIFRHRHAIHFYDLLRRAWHFSWRQQYNYLGLLLLVMSVFWGYFTLAESPGYATLTHETAVLQAKRPGSTRPPSG